MRINILMVIFTLILMTNVELHSIATAPKCGICKAEIWVECRVENYTETRAKLEQDGTFDAPRGVCDKKRCILPSPSKVLIEKAKDICKKQSTSKQAEGFLEGVAHDGSSYQVFFEDGESSYATKWPFDKKINN